MIKAFAILTALASVALFAAAPQTAAAQASGASAFLGSWCAQGLPDRRTSISESGFSLTLVNEQGSSSPGHVMGAGRIVASQWGATGTLSSNGNRISWSNNTFWERCRGGGGGGHTRDHPRLSGTWYANGDRSKACRIEQRGDSLQLRNETGQTATGSFTSFNRLATHWNNTAVFNRDRNIEGTISRDGRRIDWSNGSYWSR